MTELQDVLGKIADAIEAGLLTEAEQLCLSAMDSTPFNTSIWHALGVVCSRQGKFAEAVARFDRVLQEDPSFASAALNRGNVFQLMGRLDQAMASFNQALALKPDYPAALCNRAILHFGLGRLDEALADYEAALALSPGSIVALLGRGNTLRQLAEQKLKNRGQDGFASLMEQAMQSYRRAIEFQSENTEAHYNLATTLHRLDRLDEAIGYYGLSLRLQPSLAEAWSDMGIAQFEAGRTAEAIDSLNKALAMEPGNPKFLWNKSLYLLTMGVFEEGWTLYESRLRLDDRAAVPRSFGWLNNVSLRGKTVRIWAEQGFGDTIQFCRYVPVVARSGAKVVFHVPPQLARLLSGLGPEVEIAGSAVRQGPADYDIPLLSLPFALGTSQDSIPGAVPYLYPNDEKVRHWRDRLGAGGFKIGVTWKGGVASKLSAARSFSPACLAQLSAIPGVRLISLQKDAGEAHLLGIAIETPGPEFDAGGDAFLDCAAIIQNLDLVISCDTAIAHLAGALGRPVWVALKQVPDWRWLLSRTDCPWYPTMTLFRQERREDWDTVFFAMKQELEKRHNGRL